MEEIKLLGVKNQVGLVNQVVVPAAPRKRDDAYIAFLNDKKEELCKVPVNFDTIWPGGYTQSETEGRGQ